MEDKFWAVDIEFKDGSKLKHCAIFPEKPEQGTRSLDDSYEIKKKFTRLPWYSRWDGWIYFQNTNINGVCHVENILNFELKQITKSEF